MNEEVDKLRRLMQDLEDQHTTGFVDDAQYAEHRARLERRLVEAVMKDTSAPQAPASPPPPPASAPAEAPIPRVDAGTPAPPATRPKGAARRVALWLVAASLAGASTWWWLAKGHRAATPAATPATSEPSTQVAPAESAAPTATLEAPASGGVEPVTPSAPASVTSSHQTPSAARVGTARSVQGTVSLSPLLADRASPNDTVFIYARAVNGPPMPLALTRAQVKDLPLRFRFDDSMALWSSAKLSSFVSVVVMARVSKSGEGEARPGDLQGQSAPVPVGSEALRIDIDTVIAK